jgi:hypothetical protein
VKLLTEAVLLDRNGTLVEDVPSDRDPAPVRLRAGPMPPSTPFACTASPSARS